MRFHYTGFLFAAALIATLLLAACGSDSSSLAKVGSAVKAAPGSILETVGFGGGQSSEFSSGACKSFGPTGHDAHRTVFIDAGHGGPDPGTSGPTPQVTTIQEKSATLAVALDLLPMLRADGYRVVLSRTRDTAVARLAPSDDPQGVMTLDANHRDLLERIACANQSGAQLLLSIHFNGFTDPSVGGSETFYDNARPFADDNQRFAMLVQQDVTSALANGGWNTRDRGIALDSSDNAPTLSAQAAAYQYLLELGPADPGWLDHPSQMPGALCEPLFLTDPQEASIAASQSGQKAIALGFARAIESYFAGAAAGA